MKDGDAVTRRRLNSHGRTQKLVDPTVQFQLAVPVEVGVDGEVAARRRLIEADAIEGGVSHQTIDAGELLPTDECRTKAGRGCRTSVRAEGRCALSHLEEAHPERALDEGVKHARVREPQNEVRVVVEAVLRFYALVALAFVALAAHVGHRVLWELFLELA